MNENYVFPLEIFEGQNLESNSTTLKFEKDETLPETIINHKIISIIEKGIVVIFWEDESKIKTIVDFKCEGEVLRPAIEVSSKKTGRFHAQSLTNSEITSIDRDFFCSCSIKKDEISDFYYGLLTEDISSTYRQLKLLKEADLEKRYETFLKEYKHVYNIISDRMIANFLGVHYTTLSRVKARLINKARDC